MVREPFVTGDIYHIYNRGVDKRDVFMDDKDRYRFVHDLYEFNDENPVTNVDFRFTQTQNQTMGVGLPYMKKQRKLLADVLVFCLMNNHFHLMLSQKTDGGITLLMRKLGAGYTNYFNEKYTRTGSLFQGKFKSVHLEKQAHFLYLPHYIHLNPRDILSSQSLSDLEKYRWSSLPDYLGKKNFPSVTQREFLLEIYGGNNAYKKDLSEWINDSNDSEMNDVTID